MLENNDQGIAKITQDDVLEVLVALKRPHFDKRRLTYFSDKKIGLLPELRRASRPGSNSPMYVWDEGVMEQIIDLYDFVERGWRDYHSRLLYLWLRGHNVPFEPLLQLWLQPAEKALHAIIDGAEDLDKMLERVSSFIAEHWEPKWKFSPRPDPTIRKMGFNDYLTGAEFLLSAFLVPNYQPEESLRVKVSTIFQHMGGTSTPPPSEETRAWLPIFQEIIALPQLRNALFHASGEAWIQARADYQTLRRWLRTAMEISLSRTLSLFSDPDMQEFRDRFFLLGGFYLVPLLLSARYYGYGGWIDQGIAWVDERLSEFNGPEARERLSRHVAQYMQQQARDDAVPAES